MSTGEIPFLDLVTVHRELREELRSVFETAFDTAGFIGGAVVQEFEREFAEFCDSRFCVGTASGTDGLRLALVAAGVQRGDTVDCAAHLHRHDGGDLAGRCATGFRRH